MDVLLTASTSKLRRITAVATKGPFTHAALVAGGSTLFESNGLGLGLTPLRLSRYEQTDIEGIPLCKLNGVKAAILLRHPQTVHLDSGKLHEILEPFVISLSGLEYPRLIKLAATLEHRPTMHAFARRLLATLDRVGRHKPIVEGPFCSQLVAMVFESLNIPLFCRQIKPESISPNSFLNSNLVVVPGAVRYANINARNDEEFVEHSNTIADTIGHGSRAAMTSLIVELARQNFALSEAADRFDSVLDQLDQAFERLRNAHHTTT